MFRYRIALVLFPLFVVLAGSPVWSKETTVDKYKKRSFIKDGREIWEVVVPGRPPKDHREPVAAIEAAAGDVVLSSVPAFDWSYGCSATSAAMMVGFYDNGGYGDMYTGPTNGGVCPLTNAAWGAGECPLSATHMGYDGLGVRGHVDDYWITYNNPGPDPYIANGWPEHTSANCTGDFMGTNQSKFGNVDGGTTFYYYQDGSPLYDYDAGSSRRDGCHGIRLFAESRGYTVTDNFTQLIDGYQGNALGFTFQDYVAEIDAGRPVMIQVAGHSMLGFGYNPTGTVVYLHDTWDYGDHSMTWGGSYSNMKHWGVTVLRLEPVSSNHRPTANAQSLGTNEDTPIGITLTGSDPDNDPITFAVATYPAHGTLSGTVPNLTYMPVLDYNGPDSFTFTVNDGQATSAPATVSIAVSAVNDPPTGRTDNYQTAVNRRLVVRKPGVLKNDTDPDGDSLTAMLVTTTPNGSLTFLTDGSFTYVPRAGFDATDGFTYEVSDGKASSGPVTVTITVKKKGR